MWYNVIPPFVLLDLSLYPTRTKGLDFMMFRNYMGYVPRYEYLVLEKPIVPPTHTPHFVGNKFLKMVHLIINRDRELVQ